MAQSIQRLRCPVLPDVTIISIGINPTVYLVRASQLLGYLLSEQEHFAQTSAIRTFMSSAGGQMEKGGELTSAFLDGPLTAMIYTYQLVSDVGGCAYHFLTEPGLQYVLSELPGQDISAHSKLRSIFGGGVPQTASFTSVDLAQDVNDNNHQDKCIEGFFTAAAPRVWAGAFGTSGSMHALQMELIERKASERILLEQLKAAEQVKTAELKASELRVEYAEREAKEKAAGADARVREAVAAVVALNEKNMEIMRLQMQLSHFKDKAKVSDTDRGRKRSLEGSAAGNVSPVPASGGSGDPMPAAGDGANDDVPAAGDGANDDVPAAGDGANDDVSAAYYDVLMSQQSGAGGAPSPVLPNQGRGAPPGPVRPSQHYMVSPLYGVFDLAPVKWSGDDFKAKRFVELGDDVGGYVVPVGAPRQCRVQPGVIVKFADGIDGSQYREIVRHRVFGFCYRGAPVSKAALEQSTHINAAFGVESGGVQFVCVMLFSLYRRSMALASSVPYLDNMLPRTIALELIPGRDHHITVYKHGVPTTDPVAEMLFDPSLVGWIWRSKRTNGNRAAGGRG